MAVVKNNDLLFGQMYSGIPVTVDKTDAGSAAEFLITGRADMEVIIDFNLPTYMNQSGFNMGLIFSNTDCSADSSGTPDQSSPTFNNLNPWTTITARLGNSGQLVVWLGGLAVPKLVQSPGSYTGTIQIIVDSTGN